MRPLNLIGLVIVVGMSAATSQTASAQNFRQYKYYDRYRYLPRLPERADGPPPLPREEPKVTGDPKVLVEKLKGLVFVDDPKKVVKGKIAKTGVHIESDGGLEMLRSMAFQSLAQSYLDKPVSMRRLNELVRDIIVFYRNNDQPVVDVSIPAEQDITDGTVQVVVTEARVGNVCVTGPCYFNPQVLVDQVFIRPGDPIYESMLMEDLRWLYRNPFRTVNLELKPGENRGETDVLFKVEDQLPVRVYGGYEDTGSQFTGLERTFYGVNWYNALFRDDQAGYQLTASSDFNSLLAHSAFYSTALPNRDIFTLYGSYAEFQAPVPGVTNLFASQGFSWYLLGRWYRELESIGHYEQAITAGMDLKETQYGLRFLGLNVFSSETSIVQFMLGYIGKYRDENGGWGFGGDFYASPGNWGGHNNTQSFRTARAFATPYYFYMRGFAQYYRNLPYYLQFMARFTGQLSEGNLLPTEQLGLGGYNSIRGYNLYSVVADSGFFANLELRTQPIKVNWPGCSSCDNECEPTFSRIKKSYDDSDTGFVALIFYDIGNGFNHNLLPGQSDNFDLHSAGFGFRYKLQPQFSIRFDYGWQLSNQPLQAIVRTPTERVHLGAWLSY